MSHLRSGWYCGIEALEGGNNIRVSKGYKPSIEETKSKIRESIVRFKHQAWHRLTEIVTWV